MPIFTRCLLMVFVLLTKIAYSFVTSSDIARRFGVAEGTLSKGTKWRVECDEDSSDFFERFRDFEEIGDYLEQKNKASPKTTRLQKIGFTAEKRPIYAFEFKSMTNHAPKILAIAGLHGREWTSIAALLYALENLDESDLKGVSLTVIPVVNPDGYVKTFSGNTHVKEKFSKANGIESETQPDRYWRKNGLGIDLNRNFGSSWGNDNKTKSLRMKNSDVYQGTKPFSEAETNSLREWAKANIQDLQAIIDFHCCIGAVLAPPIPVGTSQKSSSDNEIVGKKITEALSAGGKGVTKIVKGGDGLPGEYQWRPRSSKDQGAGLSSTWGFVDLLVDLTYVVELRGKFVAPCYEIRQLGQEVLFAMQALLSEVAKRPVLNLLERQQVRYAAVKAGSSDASYVSLHKSGRVLSLLCLLIVVFLFLFRGKFVTRKKF